MKEFFMALALVLVIEGLLYATLTDHMKEMMETFMAMPENMVKIAGLVVATIGVFIYMGIKIFI